MSRRYPVKHSLLIVCIIGLFANYALALQDPYIFTKEDQSQETQASDKSACQTWAKQETGVDPAYIKGKLSGMQEAGASGVNQNQKDASGGILRGAARGAAFGALDKNIDDGVGEAAAKGALYSAMKGKDARKRAEAEQKALADAKKQQELTDQYNNYTRAFTTCMEAKGYSEK